MKYDFHSIVIGAGSAGLSVASGLALFGAKTALIEKNKMGGECLNTGCVPSKTLLKSAHLLSDIKNSWDFGIRSKGAEADFEAVMSRIKSVIGEIAKDDSIESFNKKGVEVIMGEASFVNNHTVEVLDKKITAKYIVLATGSGPMIPPIQGLNSVPFYTNENIFELKALPQKLLVLGAGAVGLELSQAFRLLGCEVSCVDLLPNIFSKDEPEAGLVMEKILKKDGIDFHLGSKINDIRGSAGNIIVGIEKEGKIIDIRGDALLVALGRSARKINGIDKTKVKTDKRGYIIADSFLRTGEKNIFACGDIVGPYQFTHMAGYQARVVVQNIVFPFKTKADYSAVPWTTFTRPEVSRVGYSEEQAEKEGIFKDSAIIWLSNNDRALTEGDTSGFIKLIIGKNARLIGATLVSENAGEMINLASLAIIKKLKAQIFSEIIYSYPAKSEIYKSASNELLKRSLRPWMKSLVRHIFVR